MLNGSAILRRERIAVSSSGELVVMKLGNVEIRLPYETALLLSQWLRVRAKEAKRRAGDSSRHWSVVGTLHDANHGPDVTRG
jgi:hypothetical protein